MDQRERDELKSILREAQEIVEDGLGGSLSNSVARDSVLVHLSGAMVTEWFERTHPPTGAAPKMMGMNEDLFREVMDHVRAAVGDIVQIGQQAKATELAEKLTTGMMMAQWPGDGWGRERVWETFDYFLKQGSETLAAPATPLEGEAAPAESA